MMVTAKLKPHNTASTGIKDTVKFLTGTLGWGDSSVILLRGPGFSPQNTHTHTNLHTHLQQYIFQLPVIALLVHSLPDALIPSSLPWTECITPFSLRLTGVEGCRVSSVCCTHCFVIKRGEHVFLLSCLCQSSSLKSTVKSPTWNTLISRPSGLMESSK